MAGSVAAMQAGCCRALARQAELLWCIISLGRCPQRHSVCTTLCPVAAVAPCAELLLPLPARAAQVECEVRSADVERIGVDVLSSELQVGRHWWLCNCAVLMHV